MEYRKLIGFGKNSYIVTLPKSWVQKNKLNKGDVIYIDEKTDELSLYPKHKQIDNKNREVTINIDGKNLSQISREITTAYINNFNSFTITGKDLQSKAKEIRLTLQNLMALEIMDQTATKMVAKDFIDMESISLNDLIRKMDMITREMIRDSKNSFMEDNCDNLYLRDEDVNRIAHLIFRVARHSLENPHLAKKLGHNSTQIMNAWKIVYVIEGIADEAKRISKYLHESGIGKKEARELEEIYSLVENLYLSSMKSFYTEDGKTAINLSGTKKEIIGRCNDFRQRCGKNKNLVSAIEKIKNMILIANEINRLTSHFNFENNESNPKVSK